MLFPVHVFRSELHLFKTICCALFAHLLVISHIREIFLIVRKLLIQYCIKIIESFPLPFQYPLQMDLVLNLSHDGIRLIFDPVSQRLKVGGLYWGWYSFQWYHSSKRWGGGVETIRCWSCPRSLYNKHWMWICTKDDRIPHTNQTLEIRSHHSGEKSAIWSLQIDHLKRPCSLC